MDFSPAARRIRPRGKSVTAFRTISEVSAELGVPQHVLRFWETKFAQLRPLKRGGGRRYYRPEDLVLLRRIHELLYKEGYTIKGVQRMLRSPGRDHGDEPPEQLSIPGAPGDKETSLEAVLRSTLNELKELRALLS
jgi:DNA-binding transcriptional MerR regulator